MAGVLGGRIDLGDVVVGADLLVEGGGRSGLEARVDVAPFGGDTEALGEAGEERLADLRRRGGCRAQQGLQRGDAGAGVVEGAFGELGLGHVEGLQHAGGVHVEQDGRLIEERVAGEEAAGAGDLAAVDLDVVPRAVFRRDAELREPQRDGLADAARGVAQGGQIEALAMEDQFEAELALVHVERAAAGNAADSLDTVVAAPIGADLARQRLMAADQRRGREGEEADGVADLAGPVGVDQGLIEGDVGAATANTGVDHSEGDRHRWVSSGVSSGANSCERSISSQASSGFIPNWRRIFVRSRLLGGKG